MSLAATVLVYSSRRSARVDLPWSICAIMQKLRIFFISGNLVQIYKKSPASANALSVSWPGGQNRKPVLRPKVRFDLFSVESNLLSCMFAFKPISQCPNSVKPMPALMPVSKRL